MIIHYLSLMGVFLYAMSGALAAGEKKLDWIGVVVLATITALGGGTIRDVLIQREVIFWIAEPSYVWTSLVASAFTIGYFRFFKPPCKLLLYADALGLAFFTIIGAKIAEDAGMPVLVIVLMGIITGVAGGVLRDVMCSDVPLIFRPTSTLYSVAALAGVLVYLLVDSIELGELSAAISGILVIAVIRFVAIVWNIRLPAFHISSE